VNKLELEKVDERTYKLNKYQRLREGKNKEYRIITPSIIDGRICWKNLFRIDITILFLLIALVLVMYNNDLNMRDCSEIIENPDDFCEGYVLTGDPTNWGWSIGGDKEYTGDSP